MKSQAFDIALSANSIATSEGFISEANTMCLRLWGYSGKKDVAGKPVANFFMHPSEAATIMATLNEIGGWQGDFTAKRMDGSIFLAHGLATVMRDENGQIIGFQSSVVDITERKQAEQVRRNSEALLNTVQHLSKVGGWLFDIEHQHFEWTDETYRIHGYEPNENKGSLDEHYTKSLQLCDEADRPAVLAAFRRCAELGEPYDIEYGFTTAAGLRRFMRSTAKAVWDGPSIVQVVGNIIDVTERKQAQVVLEKWNTTLEARVAERTQELQDSEARFRQLSEASFEGVAVVDNGILLDGNPRFAEMHGYKLPEMLGRPVSEFVAPQSRRSVAQGFRNKHPRSHVVFGLRKDGKVFSVETHMRIGQWRGHPVHIITSRDLTESKAEESKLITLRMELARAQHLALVSEVSAGIIHQLSQPLSCLGTNLAVLLKLKAAELERCDAMELINDIVGDVTRMREIVTHLRAIANPEQVNRSSSCINALAAAVLPLLQARADHAQVHFKLDLCESLPAVHADSIQLSQVIFNLARNAIEASAGVPPERRMVIITTRPHTESSVELCVRDHGCGLSADSIARLFSPFFSTKSDGMGVGLRLCQTIIQAHDGQIDGFNNADGIGATFRIELPVHP